MLRRDLAPLDSYLADAMQLDEAAFLDRFPWPVLVTPEPSPDLMSTIRRGDTTIIQQVTLEEMDPMAPGMVGASLDALCLEVRPLEPGRSPVPLMRIGRAPSADVVLIDESISRVHAELSWDREIERATLVDLDTKNGTFVDQRRLPPLKEVTLVPGSVVSFGGLATRYYSPRTFRAWLATGAPRSGASPSKWPGT